MKYLDMMNRRLKAFSQRTGISGKDLAKMDQEDLQFICDPTMRMTDPIVLSGPTMNINRQGRTSVIPGSRKAARSEFSDSDRVMMKAMDLSEADYREFEDPETGKGDEVVENIKRHAGIKETSFKEKFDAALGLTAADYAKYENVV